MRNLRDIHHFGEDALGGHRLNQNHIFFFGHRGHISFRKLAIDLKNTGVMD